MRQLKLLCLPLLLCTSISAQSPDPDAHTRVGDKMPALTVEEVSGKTFSLASESGKVVVVNFWATWCPPCRIEMPRLEKEVWQRYRSSPDFAMVAIAREQTKDVITAFQQKNTAFTYPMAPDPKRSTYALFANAGIPRTYVVDRHGKIVFQSIGYSDADFTALDQAIRNALAAK